MLRESIDKLDPLCLKKRRRTNLSSDRRGRVNLTKLGSQVHKTPNDASNQTSETKQIQPSATDMQLESMSATAIRQKNEKKRMRAEFEAVENKSTEKGMKNSEFDLSAKKDGYSNLQIRKNKISTDEFGDCVQRKGRTRRNLSLTRPGLPSAENMRPADKSKMKHGCPPSKKQKDCKVSTRVGQMHNNGSSHFADLASSGPFLEKMEASFATISEENVPFLKQQMTVAEEFDKTLSQMLGVDHVMDDIMNNEATHCSEERQRSCCDGKGAKTGKCNGKRLDNANSLFKLLCSAIIPEDGIEELNSPNEAMAKSQKCSRDDSHCDSCNQFDYEPRYLDETDFEVDRRLLLELHSIGLYPETLPDLAEEEEDEAENRNIVVPKEKLCQQIERKKKDFNTTDRSMKKGRDPEVLATGVNLNGLLNFRVKGKRSRRDRNRRSGQSGKNTISRGGLWNSLGSHQNECQCGDDNAGKGTSEGKQSAECGNLQLAELDSMEKTGLCGDLGGHQDLGSWLNIDDDDDDDDLPDNDLIGLQIPMDDLSEIM